MTDPRAGVVTGVLRAALTAAAGELHTPRGGGLVTVTGLEAAVEDTRSARKTLAHLSDPPR